MQRDAILRLSGSVPRLPTYGKYPAVAINDRGIVVELHQPSFISTTICCQIGSVNGERIVFSESTDLDRGKFPKVAINNANRVVEVHEGRLRRLIYYRIGRVEVPAGGNLSCRWQGVQSVPLNQRGRLPAIAVHDNTALITYDKCYGVYKTYYHIGTINADGTNINWGERIKLFEESASNTSVAMNAEYVVVVGHGWSKIMCCVARIQPAAGDPQRAPQVIAKREIDFQYSCYCPNICLTADQHVVLVWQTSTGRQLKCITGRIAVAQNPEERTINFTQAAGRFIPNVDFGYNPSISVSLDGQHIVEEHETNFINRHCTLHYHTGVLERDRNNQEPGNAAQGEQGRQPEQPPPPQPARRDGEHEEQF